MPIAMSIITLLANSQVNIVNVVTEVREECHPTITTYNCQVNIVNVVTEVREEYHPTITTYNSQVNIVNVVIVR